jgi:hypothetical protein
MSLRPKRKKRHNVCEKPLPSISVMLGAAPIPPVLLDLFGFDTVSGTSHRMV